jgi:hypothetical protein
MEHHGLNCPIDLSQRVVLSLPLVVTNITPLLHLVHLLCSLVQHQLNTLSLLAVEVAATHQLRFMAQVVVVLVEWLLVYQPFLLLLTL